MPNGGVPAHMALYPRNGALVIYCHRGALHIIEHSEWQRHQAQATPLAVLSRPEAIALAWQLRYWLGETDLRPGYTMRDEIHADYDF